MPFCKTAKRPYDLAVAALLCAAERLAHAADALGWTVEADYMAGSVEFKTALRAWREVSGE